MGFEDGYPLVGRHKSDHMADDLDVFTTGMVIRKEPSGYLMNPSPYIDSNDSASSKASSSSMQNLELDEGEDDEGDG